jgi:hypothetical protein
MFEFIKSLFRRSENKVAPLPPATAYKAQTVTEAKAPAKKKATKKAVKKATSKKHTKASLGKLTKVQLEEIGRAEFSVELDRRKKKDALVAELLAAQKAKK